MNDTESFPILSELTERKGPTVSEVEETVERYFPDPAERKAAVELMARAVEIANSENPSSWQVTFSTKGDFVRLNVCRIATVAFMPSVVSIAISDPPQGLQLPLENTRRGGFNSLPGATWIDMPSSALAEMFKRGAEPLFTETLRRSAHQTRSSPYAGYHAPAVVDFLNEATGRSLPQPGWMRPPLEELHSRIVETLQQAYPGWDSFSHGAFVRDEIAYKHKAVELASELLSKGELARLNDSGEAGQIIERLERVGQSTNLLYLSVPKAGDLSILYSESLDKVEFARQIAALLHGDGKSPERLQRYLTWVEANGLPNQWTFPTYFLFLCHPESELFLKPVAATSFLTMLGSSQRIRGAADPQVYARCLDIAEELRRLMAPEGARDMVDVQSVLWVCGRLEERKRKGNGQQYWKIAPGEKAWNWEACRKGQFIAIGWDELGDLTELSKSEFDDRLEPLVSEHEDWTTAGADQAWKFVHSIKEGDIVFANKGTTQVLGIGTVTGPYYFVEGVRHGHRIPVEWSQTEPFDVSEGGWRMTLIKLQDSKGEELLRLAGTVGGNGDPEGSTKNPERPLREIAEEHGFDLASLRSWVRAIQRKGQAVLYGPPGTGKTFVAEQLARHLIGGGEGEYDLVQFHPAYAYEDFIQGIRPRTENGQVTYELAKGRFLEFCDKARQTQDPCVLIIDEINRANLSRVFGELMYLLENRDKRIPLAGGRSFEIPSNVFIIGTMNTADRSIALVDHALRRRFAFLALSPTFGILRHFHESRATGFDPTGLIHQLEAANRQINDRHYEIGISFFMREDIEDQIEDVWSMEIVPYLEEYFFDQPVKAAAFAWAEVGEKILGE